VFISPSVFILEIYNVYSEVENVFVENLGEILLHRFHKKLNSCAGFFVYSEIVCAFTYSCGVLSLVFMYCQLCGRYQNKIFLSFQTWKEVMPFQHVKGRPAVVVAHIPSRNERRRKVLDLCAILILKSIFRNTKACCKDFS
jgi:hypothetical protein